MDKSCVNTFCDFKYKAKKKPFKCGKCDAFLGKQNPFTFVTPYHMFFTTKAILLLAQNNEMWNSIYCFNVNLAFVKNLAPSGPIASGMTSHVKFPCAFKKSVQSGLSGGIYF